jgi:hypothetical protein
VSEKEVEELERCKEEIVRLQELVVRLSDLSLRLVLQRARETISSEPIPGVKRPPSLWDSGPDSHSHQ